MTRTYDVIVVGGGAVGAAVAREAARGGRSVLVLERGGSIGQAWRAAAGMLAPQAEAHADGVLFRFGLAAREHYRGLIPALHATTGIGLAFWQHGIVQLARGEAEAAALRGKAAWQREAGETAETIDADEVRHHWPWLGEPVTGALVAPRDGALEPARLVDALLADARRAGAAVLDDTVLTIEHRDDRLTGVVGARDRYSGGDVVLAAGAWSATIGGASRPVPVEPLRGQMVALPWPAEAPPGIFFGSACYLLSRGGEAITGSTMERAGFHADTTPEGVRGIVAAARELCPSLSDTPLRAWAGLRPVTPDGLPIIGPDPRVRGLWYATGHGRNGILLAGLTGALVARLLAGEPAGSDLAAFSPTRF